MTHRRVKYRLLDSGRQNVTMSFVWWSRKKNTERDTMTSKTISESSTIVITSGMSSTVKGSPATESREQERAWKAYLASTDAPLTASLLTQMNGGDSNMSTTLGFLYDLLWSSRRIKSRPAVAIAREVSNFTFKPWCSGRVSRSWPAGRVSIPNLCALNF